MKVNSLRKFLSLLLALASIFALVTAGLGVRDAQAIQKELQGEPSEDGEDPLVMLEDGINQIADNEKTYFDGVKTYVDGQAQLAQGEKDLADGAVQLADGRSQLADGAAKLRDGERQLADGKRALAAGQKQIDDNTAAYKEGKETLSKIEPLVPYLEQYIAFRDGTIAKLPGFETAQEWFVAVVRPLAAQLGLDIPKNVVDFPKYVTNMVADGKAQLKQYEDGLKALKEGKAQLAAGQRELNKGYSDYNAGKAQLAQGEKDFADGQKQLKDGKKQLKEGKKQLAQFEDGVAQIKGGMDTIRELRSFATRKGKMVVAAPFDVLGKDFDITKYDKNGKPVKMNDGETMIDTEAAMKVCKAAQQYKEDLTKAATDELMGRIKMYAVLALGALLGLIAAIFGFFGKGTIPAIIAAVLGVVANIMGIANHYTNYYMTLANGSAAGYLQTAAAIIFGLVAICAAIVFWNTRRKKAEEARIEDIEPEVKADGETL